MLTEGSDGDELIGERVFLDIGETEEAQGAEAVCAVEVRDTCGGVATAKRTVVLASEGGS